MNNDTLEDLVIANALDSTVTIVFQTDGNLPPKPNVTRSVGTAPSDITIVDVDGRFGPEILVSGEAGGEVSVLYNDASHAFGQSSRYRAGQLPYDLSQGADPKLRSLNETVALWAGRLSDGDDFVDVVTVNRGAHSSSILAGQAGGFVDPRANFLLSERPSQVSGQDFNGDDKTDLAFLMEDTGEIWIYFADDAKGGFSAEPKSPCRIQLQGIEER